MLEFKCLSAAFSEDSYGIQRQMGNEVASQLRSYVFDETDLGNNTKLTIQRPILRPTILCGS